MAGSALRAVATRLLGARADAFFAKGMRARLAAVGHLLSGNFLNAAIMLVSTAIAARSLGPSVYGIMVMVLSYNRVVERIMRFECWQPVIRFAVQDELKSSPRKMGRLYAYGL